MYVKKQRLNIYESILLSVRYLDPQGSGAVDAKAVTSLMFVLSGAYDTATPEIDQKHQISARHKQAQPDAGLESNRSSEESLVGFATLTSHLLTCEQFTTFGSSSQRRLWTINENSSGTESTNPLGIFGTLMDSDNGMLRTLVCT
jgi:hypothetical protein